MSRPQSPVAEAAPAGAKETAGQESYPSAGYAWYVVGVLTIAYIFSFIDRQILNLLVGPIRRDLGISDTQMSLLMGTSFAVFYTFFGIPFGRLADSRSRRALITWGLVFWSLMTAACGLAKNYWHLLLARMGVGVGEATLSPSAFSLISDYFPKERRATAISVYSMGIYIGSGMAFLLGGLVVKFALAKGNLNLPIIGETRPWQVIFFLVGLSGVVFALFMATVKEPLRKGLRMVRDAEGRAKATGVPLSEVMSYLLKNRVTFLCHNVGFALLSLSSYGSAAWIPEYFIRKHGWSNSQAGVVYGTLVMIFGSLGIAAGGRIADWMRRRGHRDANMRVGLISALAWFPTGILYPVMSDATISTVLLAPTVFFVAMSFGVAPAAIQEMMPNEMRGQASAIYLFVVNLIGLGLGPTAVAMMTDYVFRNDYAVNYSLLSVATVAHVVAAALLWISLKAYLQSLDRLKEWMKATA
jgi:MFS family permease